MLTEDSTAMCGCKMPNLGSSSGLIPSSISGGENFAFQIYAGGRVPSAARSALEGWGKACGNVSWNLPSGVIKHGWKILYKYGLNGKIRRFSEWVSLAMFGKTGYLTCLITVNPTLCLILFVWDRSWQLDGNIRSPKKHRRLRLIPDISPHFSWRIYLVYPMKISLCCPKHRRPSLHCSRQHAGCCPTATIPACGVFTSLSCWRWTCLCSFPRGACSNLLVFLRFRDVSSMFLERGTMILKGFKSKSETQSAK